MRRISQDEGRQKPARIADERGFTLIELLVTMVVAIIVLGGATYGLARAFNQSNDISARTSSTDQAEVGLQQFTRDLRFATACPTYNGTNSIGAGNTQVNGVLVSAGPVLQMCDPLSGSHASQPPALELVTWTCNTGATSESCTRAFSPILCPGSSGTTAATGPCTTGAPQLATSVVSGNTVTTTSGTMGINGVSVITVSGIISGTSQANLLTDSTCAVGSGYYSYGLTTGSTCPLSWAGLSLTVMPLITPSNPGAAANASISNDTAPVQLTTGTALQNYGL